MRSLKSIAFLLLLTVIPLNAEDAILEIGVDEVFSLQALLLDPPIGETVSALATVSNPYSGDAMPGILLEGRLTFEFEDRLHEITAQATSDAEGRAILDFPLPLAGLFLEFGGLEITATRDRMIRQVEIDLFQQPWAKALVATDKGVYRPGDTLHMRALWTRADRILPDQPVEFELRDPQGRVVLLRPSRTSAMGIAQETWTLPHGLTAGTYPLLTRWKQQRQRSWIDISTAERPRFLVRASTIKDWFRPDESIGIEVTARTLTGQPLANARAGLRRSRESTARSDEVPEVLSQLDASGRGVLEFTRVELPNRDIESLAHESFEVWVEDPQTGRRIHEEVIAQLAWDPIVLEVSSHWRLTRDDRAAVWVTTSDLNGRPASCDVTLEVLHGEDSSRLGQYSLKTDHHGLGEWILDTELAEQLEESHSVKAFARDSQGAEGHATQRHFWSFAREPIPSLDAYDRLLPPGKDLRVWVKAPPSPTPILVQVHGEAGRLSERRIESEPGEWIPVRFEFQPTFRGAITVVAIAERLERGLDYPQRAVWTAYYLGTSPKFSVEPERPNYRPGETASLNLEFKPPDSRTNAAAALVVLDRAAVELARSSHRGGRGIPLLDSGHGLDWEHRDEESFHGWTEARLARLKPEKAGDPALQRLANFLILDRYWEFYQEGHHGLDDDLHAIREAMQPQRTSFQVSLRRVTPTLEREAAEHGRELNVRDLETLLRNDGFNLTNIEDPWGTVCRIDLEPPTPETFHKRVASLHSAGRDRTWNTVDDLELESETWQRLSHIVPALQRATRQSRESSLIADIEHFKNALKETAFHWETLLDPWQQPYRHHIDLRNSHWGLKLVSQGGPESTDGPRTAHTYAWEVLSRPQKIRDQLIDLFVELDRYPTLLEIDAALARENLGLNDARDPWGHPFVLTVRQEKTGYHKVYSDSETPWRRAYEEVRKPTLALLSLGEDGIQDTPDDEIIHRWPWRSVWRDWTRIRYQQRLAALGQWPKTGALDTHTGQESPLEGEVVLRVRIEDDYGGALPGVTVLALDPETRFGSLRVTNDEGIAEFALPAGSYEVEASLSGFVELIYDRVTVKADELSELTLALEVQLFEEIVVSSQMANERPKREKARPPVFQAPRLRQNFQETLLFIPELELSEGRIQVPVELADNITTWDVAAMASTASGRILTARTEIVSTLDLYVEPDLPPVLTVGDEIEIPIALHNLSNRDQTVDVQVEPVPGVEIIAQPDPQTVPAGQFKRLGAALRIGNQVLDLPLRVTARGETFADAVERSSEIRSGGKKHHQIITRLIRDHETLTVEIPDLAIPGTARLDVQLYPDLDSHLGAAIDRPMQRPTGCIEQTLSAAWPSLLMLRYAKLRPEMARSLPLSQARRHIVQARDRLNRAQDSRGGIGYWAGGQPDFAVSAHALLFWHLARPHVDIEPGRITRTVQWLLRRQNVLGGWGVEAQSSTDSTTLLIARALAVLTRDDLADNPGHTKSIDRLLDAIDGAVRQVLARPLPPRDPYQVATYALIARTAEAHEQWHQAADQLASMASPRQDGVAWRRVHATPFYSWGRVAEVEITGLAVQALLGLPQHKDLAKQGMTFLLRNKDAAGFWWSTSSTVQALTALLDATALGLLPAGNGGIDILLDGVPLSGLERSSAISPSWLPKPLRIEPGRRRIEVRPTEEDASGLLLVQATWDEPWPQRAPEASEDPPLHLAVDCLPRTLVVGETVNCRIHAQRALDSAGRGMLIAEVGLPPGAEVDRASLEPWVGWGPHRPIAAYEVLPDRLVVYLREGTAVREFAFRFKPRYAIRAQSGAMTLWDYYNPQARVEQPPMRYVVDRPNR